jgi:hypothetical protein
MDRKRKYEDEEIYENVNKRFKTTINVSISINTNNLGKRKFNKVDDNDEHDSKKIKLNPTLDIMNDSAVWQRLKIIPWTYKSLLEKEPEITIFAFLSKRHTNFAIESIESIKSMHDTGNKYSDYYGLTGPTGPTGSTGSTGQIGPTGLSDNHGPIGYQGDDKYSKYSTFNSCKGSTDYIIGDYIYYDRYKDDYIDLENIDIFFDQMKKRSYNYIKCSLPEFIGVDTVAMVT